MTAPATAYYDPPAGAAPMQDYGDDPALDTGSTVDGHEFRRTWRAVDLDAPLADDWTPIVPTVGRRADDIGLFYPGRIHTVSSESEGGKSWLALTAAIDELLTGQHVVYIDFEDDEGGITSRLRTLQVAKEVIRSRFHYVRPEDPIGTGIHRDDLAALLGDTDPTLVILDGVTEAMTLHGLDPLNNKDAATFGRQLPKWIAAHGPAVVALDHLTKSRDGSQRYSLGAVHKLNAVDGAAFLLENRTSFGIGMTGRSTVKITKDRPGQLRRHSLPSSQGLWWFADLVLTSHHESFVEAELEAPVAKGEDFVPTVVMAKLWKLIDHKAGDTGLSGRKVQDLARGKAQTNREALTHLEVGGYITASPHRTLKPYPPEDDR